MSGVLVENPIRPNKTLSTGGNNALKQEQRAKFIILGSIVAIIGFFLPWATVTIPGEDSIAMNGPEWQIPAIWAVLVAAIIMLIIGFATFHNAGGLANNVQRLLHVAKTVGTLYTFFSVVSSGDLTTVAQTTLIDSGGSNLDSYYTALGTHVDISYGFWVMVIGFVISAIGVYSKEKKQIPASQDLPEGTGSRV